jgi:hypothetical protein
MVTTLEKELRELVLALALFLVGLGYAVSGLPANIVVGCVIWGFAWMLVAHLFFVSEYTESCPTDVKIVLWGAVTFLVVLILLRPVQTQYAKEHAPTPLPAPTPSLPMPPVRVPAVRRSYLVFDGTFHFGKHNDKNGMLRADQNFQVGDLMWFDFFFKNLGPNPVNVTKTFSRLYLEPDIEPETQRRIIADFRRAWASTSSTDVTIAPATPTDVDRHYGSASTVDHRIATQDDLDALRNGSEIAFVIAGITYVDNGKSYDLRRCEWLHSPALQGATVWESCLPFGK